MSARHFFRILFLFSLVFSMTAAEPAATEETKTNSVENSVVKVFATLREPDPYKPWAKGAPEEVSGSGVIIDGKRILTCAHMVTYASQVQVQANQTGDKVSATVEAIAPEMDLAVLKVKDEKFFEGHPPLPRANKLPGIKDTVLAYGFPLGGTSLSITKGIVSRIEFTGYDYPVSGLRIQVDAAINPGNSGGPAVVDDQMVGLAFSRAGMADNIGYIIPTEEIELFLQDIADGHYDGKPTFVEELQTLENDALRASLKLNNGEQGILVHKPYSDDAAYPLKLWDLITKIGDTPVDDQGKIKLGPNLRVNFSYLIQKTATNGLVSLTIVRAGKTMPVALPVPAKRPRLVYDLETSYPPYFILGPLAFSVATEQFVGGYMRSGSAARSMRYFINRENPMLTRIADKPAFPGEQLVVVSSPFFPHRLSKGYGNPAAEVVRTVNGVHPKNLNDLVQLLRDAKGDYITLEFEGHGTETMVFPREEMITSTDDILTDNGIRSQGSPDTVAVWNYKTAK